ncbi:SH3 domain-containing protein [Bacillus sp. B-jedd]|uniref:SH3 domain-containing protein n=1 Tax=Bacillus sp. B-jedd TaxID=1476857 RepID=UPI0005156823|nr:SH3 domain-containing protein [Bacillus sp. B-jedd]CEG29097.1 SH3 type 3 domain-containing protein [Bacillus sp. B-jedd]
MKVGKALFLSTGLLLGSSAPFLITEPTSVEAATIVAIPKTTYQTKVNVVMRTGAGTSYKSVMTVPKGKLVSSQSRIGNWYNISYTYSYLGKNVTKSGYVWGSDLLAYDQFTSIATMNLLTNKAAYLYPTPDTRRPASFKTVMNSELSTNQKVVNRYGETLYTVYYSGQKVYVKSPDVGQLVKLKPRNYVSTTDNNPLRTWAGSGYPSIYSVQKGAVLASDARIGNWYRVTYAVNGSTNMTGWIWGSSLAANITYTPIPQAALSTNKTAYLWPTPDTGGPASFKVAIATNLVSSQKLINQYGEPLYTVSYGGKTVYAKEVDVNINTAVLTETPISNKTFVTSDNLNLRSSASTNGSILTTIPTAAFVYPSAVVSNGWYKLSSNGQTGYVSGDYIKEVSTGYSVNRDSYQFVDLRKPSSVTATQINAYIGLGGVLSGKGQLIIDIANKYGLNSLYLAAHAIHESGFGKSEIAYVKYNLFGYGAYDATPFVGAHRFASIDQGIEYIAKKMKATYLNPSYKYYKGPYLGYSTKTVVTNTRVDANSEGMNFYYASDPYWGQRIASHMQKILPYNKAEYDKAQVSTSVPADPGIPSGADYFPPGVLAVAKQVLAVSANKGGATLTNISIPANGTFEILEKHNDYWVKLKYNGTEYWTNKISFSQYKNFISVINLGRVYNVNDSLNIRSGASTAYSIIGSYNRGDYVYLQLDANGKVITQLNGTTPWYKVKVGTLDGWISSAYIIRELQ